MALRKKTLRRMLPTTRKVARLQGEIASVGRRLKSLLDDIGRLELDSRALHARQNYFKEVEQHGTDIDFNVSVRETDKEHQQV